MMRKYYWKPVLILVVWSSLLLSVPAYARMDSTDEKIAGIAEACRKDVVKLLTGWLDNRILTRDQLFDTFYIPVPGSNPKKYNTQYDSLTDRYLQPILEKYLKDGVIFIIAVDVNGYVPTHNKKYSQDSIGISAMDLVWNRTKRMFNDRTGIAAARNRNPYLLQKYQRDTGEEMYDYSVPVFIKGEHWGAVRIGYRK